MIAPVPGFSDRRRLQALQRLRQLEVVVGGDEAQEVQRLDAAGHPAASRLLGRAPSRAASPRAAPRRRRARPAGAARRGSSASASSSRRAAIAASPRLSSTGCGRWPAEHRRRTALPWLCPPLPAACARSSPRPCRGGLAPPLHRPARRVGWPRPHAAPPRRPCRPRAAARRRAAEPRPRSGASSGTLRSAPRPRRSLPPDPPAPCALRIAARPAGGPAFSALSAMARARSGRLAARSTRLATSSACRRRCLRQ